MSAPQTPPSRSASPRSPKRRRLTPTAPTPASQPHLQPKPVRLPPALLSTLRPKTLDFDLPPVCSVSLSVHNIYICLICGRYFRGRTSNTPAYEHSLTTSHRLYISHTTLQVWVLPDSYAVYHEKLAEIAQVMRPTYTKKEVAGLDGGDDAHEKGDEGRLPRGLRPLQSLHHANFLNVAVQFLLRSVPIRDFLLLNSDMSSPPFLRVLSALCRSICARHAFRPCITPHQLANYFARAAPSVVARSDPLDVLAYFFNAVQKREGDAASAEFGKVVADAFRGVMSVETTPNDASRRMKRKQTKFWYLSLQLPPQPLFKDASERTLVPQMSLEALLAKYDGVSKHHLLNLDATSTYTLLKLPRFLVLVIRRFAKSKFGVDKNPTVVHLQKSLDLAHLCKGSEKAKGGVYELTAAVLHEGDVQNGMFNVAVRHGQSGNWYRLEDSKCVETQFELVSLAHSYLLLYQRQEREQEEKETEEKEKEKEKDVPPSL